MNNNNKALTGSVRDYTIPTDGVQKEGDRVPREPLLPRFTAEMIAQYNRIIGGDQLMINQQRRRVKR